MSVAIHDNHRGCTRCRWWRLVLVCLCALPGGWLGAAAGEGASDSGKKTDAARAGDTIVVAATRARRDPMDVPAAVDVITVDDLRERRMSRTVPEALAETPGVMVQKTAHGHGSPYIRGFTSFRNLFLIDGIRLNNSVFRPGPNQYWNTVDQLSLQRLEVVRGPGSVLYGSDAVGGTVNAVTRGPWTYTAKGVKAGANTYYRYSTAEASNTVRGEVSVSLDRRFGALVGGTYKNFGDLDVGDYGRLPRTGYNEWDGDCKLEFTPRPGHRFTFAFQNVDQDDIWRTHKTVKGVDWHGADHGSEKSRIFDQNRHLAYLRYAGEKLGSFIDAVRLTCSWQEQKELRRRVKKDNSRERQGFEVDTWGLGLQLESPSPVGRFTYGVEFYRDYVDSFKRKWKSDGTFKGDSIQGPVADDSKYDLLGIFVQDDLKVNERVELILGGRYNYIRANVDKAEDPVSGDVIGINQDWDSLVGSARVMWHVDADKHWNLWAGVSQGFRAPNLSDLTRLDSARSNEFEVGSTNLDPEEYVSYELGLKYNSKRLTLVSSYFYTDIDGMILRTPTNQTNADGEILVTKTNAGDGYVHGLELNANLRLHPQWSLFASGTIIYGKVKNYQTSAPVREDEPLTRLMPPTAVVGIRWDHPEKDLWVEFLSRMAAAADRLSSGDKRDSNRIPPGGTPGYGILTLRGGWQVHEHVKLTAALENILDKDYRIHGSGQREPGRNLVLGVSLSF